MLGDEPLFLGVDGGGTNCRVRLCDAAGTRRGEGIGGAANIRLGLDASWASIMTATDIALGEAGLTRAALGRIHAGLGLAGILGIADIERVRAAAPPFASVTANTDAHTACLGAFGGRDGAILIIGTGSAGYALVAGTPHPIGGWGFEVSDEGSGADIGRRAVRAALRAHDGLGTASGFTAAVMARLGGHPVAIVAWVDAARPKDFASLAPEALAHAQRGDPVAVDIMRRAGENISRLIRRLQALGAQKVCLMGGLAPSLVAWLEPGIPAVLATPEGDALDGAILMARCASGSL
jgi:glucosamine kinase